MALGAVAGYGRRRDDRSAGTRDHPHRARGAALDGARAGARRLRLALPPLLAPAARRFPDGTVLRPGDAIGELHLHNRRVRAIHATAGHPVPLGLTFRRLLVASLRALAGAVEADPLLRPLEVFHASTILATGAERIGFVVTAANGRAPRLRTLFFHLLLCRYHAHGLARLPEHGLPPRELWLTAKELRRRYGTVDARAGLTPGSVRALPRGRP